MEAREVTEAKEEVKVEAPKVAASLIPINTETNALAPTDHSQLARFIDQLIIAKAIPRHLENREQVISAWNFAAQLKLPPQPSLRNIAVIEGTPSLFGELPLALVQNHPDYVKIEEFCIDDKYERICYENKNANSEVFGGVVMLQRKGMEKPQSFTFTKPDAERAGLMRRAKPGMPWHSYPQVMYVRRARGMAIKSLFADAITGASIAEYDFDQAPDLKDVGPEPQTIDKAKMLNQKFNHQPHLSSAVAPGDQEAL